MNIINNAYAQSAGPADGGMSMLIMVALFFIIMYFIIFVAPTSQAGEQIYDAFIFYRQWEQKGT